MCLCGSVRFIETFAQANMRETLAGKIVLSVGLSLKHVDPFWADQAELDQIKLDLDELHKRKIDLADEILVLNVGGYYGDSTRCEIAYARQTNKLVRWWEPNRE